MSKAKPGKVEDRDAAIEDPLVVAGILQTLFESETEFPIKVEGTSTLPYASTIQAVQARDDMFILKLVRPLPHELIAGATFRMIFAADEQRLEGLITYRGREGYLQYSFLLPAQLIHADRRRHKRFPFRPRENAYVIAQDSGIPGIGVAGPLVNIGQGGLAMRVDRVLKLTDGMRIPPTTALFERGKGFARVRMQELPKLAFLEGRGITSHSTERGTEVILGLTFVGLGEEGEAALANSLALRERMYRGGQAGQSGSPGRVAEPRHGGARAASEAGAEPESDGAYRQEEAQAEAFPVTLEERLRRRSARILLVMAEGVGRQALLAFLRGHGFHRLEVTAELDRIRPICMADERRPLPDLLLADQLMAHTGDQEPLAAVRVIENHAAEAGHLRTVILCEAVDPTMLLAQATDTRFLPYDTRHPGEWLATLDGLLQPDA